MTDITFFPIGNADTTRIRLASGQRILIDFAGMPPNGDGIEFDVEDEIRADLRRAGRDKIEVVCITHLDRDHCHRFDEVFHLEHSTSHQGPGRLKIGELWVPSMAITETGLETEAAKRVQKEARHRLKDGKGIRVFSAPKALDSWLRSQKIDPATRGHIIHHAGTSIPRFWLFDDGVEFFLHSPLSWKQDQDGEAVERNSASVVMHAEFLVGRGRTKMFLGADVDSDDLSAIVDTTHRKGNHQRLDWDILKLFHHCSYKALNKDDRGGSETVPVLLVKKLMEEHGQEGSIIVSPSKKIPEALSKEGDQPPHRQAANYYRRVQKACNGQFRVTMDTPKRPLTIDVTEQGWRFVSVLAAPAAQPAVARPQRAG